MAIRIITDSAADFSHAFARHQGVEVVSMSVRFGSMSYLDGRTISHDDFYRLLRECKDMPSTSQPSPADFLPLFEEARDAGDQAIAVLLSGALSDTFQSAVTAKEMCGYDHIHIVDSRNATAGIQILVDHACGLRNGGSSAEAIVRELEGLKGRIRIFAVADTLEYLHRGGRLSGFQAGLGTVAKLKPVIAVRDGQVLVAAKTLGLSSSVRQLLRMVAEHPVDDAFPAYFLYSNDRDRDGLLLPRMKEAGILPRQLHYCSVGPTIGTHIGPGALGLAYVERSRSCKDGVAVPVESGMNPPKTRKIVANIKNMKDSVGNHAE